MCGYCVSSEMTYVLICVIFFFFLMIRRPPRSTLDRSSAASDVYKRQANSRIADFFVSERHAAWRAFDFLPPRFRKCRISPVSYTHLRAHETVLDLVCRLLLETKTTPHNCSQRIYDIILYQRSKRVRRQHDMQN